MRHQLPEALSVPAMPRHGAKSAELRLLDLSLLQSFPRFGILQETNPQGWSPYSADPSPGVTAVSDAILRPSSATPAHFFNSFFSLLEWDVLLIHGALLRRLSLKRDVFTESFTLDWGWGGRELSLST